MVRSRSTSVVAALSAIVLTGSTPAFAQGGVRQTSRTAAAGYRVADPGSATIDLLTGVRAWRVRPRVDVAALGIERRAKVDFERNGARIDARRGGPLVGVTLA
ncbi:hypothetical protein [Sphingomonas sp.]